MPDVLKEMNNNEWRNCFKDDTITECQFADFNKHGTHCCTIDEIVQTRWYGCKPQDIINKKSKEYEEEEKNRRLLPKLGG